MDLVRKIGIGIAMIIPTFVGCGAVWALLHSWLAVLVWFIIMTVLFSRIISGRPSAPARA
jgi:hypothetical protein